MYIKAQDSIWKNLVENIKIFFPFLVYYEKENEKIGMCKGTESYTITYHPRLPIAVMISTKTSGQGALRILNSKEKKADYDWKKPSREVSMNWL